MSDIVSDEAPAPRLCHLIKWDDFDGYGFNLHAEQSNPGQFIGKIDDDSPARMAGLREGDRIVEVNGVNISNENHKQVVERIKMDPNEARLLVVDPEADLWYRERELVVKSSQMNVVYIKTPVPRPGSESPRAKHAGPTSGQSSASGGGASQASGQQQSQPSEQKQDEKQSSQQQQQQQQQQSDSAPSLETSDFNDDSIEQQNRPSTPTPRAPMSPDSGRGEEAPASGQVLTVEAEINRQTQAAGVDAIAKGRKQQLVDEVKRQIQAGSKGKQQQQMTPAEDNGDASTNDIQPDSLQTADEPALDAKERARQVHNRSADSGKSSSRETATSGNESDNNASSHSSLAADSLDDHHLTGQQQAHKQQLAATQKAPLPSADATTVTNSAPVQARKDADGRETMTPIGSTTTTASPLQQQQQEQQVSSLKTTGVAAGDDQDEKSPEPLRAEPETQNSINIQNNNNNHDDHKVYEKPAALEQLSAAEQMTGALATSGPAAVATATQQQPTTSPVTVTNSNTTTTGGQPPSVAANSSNSANKTNSSQGGLNLNMTASQMRELIASRKKFDPKKAQMNIRQKYEIIQQM